MDENRQAKIDAIAQWMIAEEVAEFAVPCNLLPGSWLILGNEAWIRRLLADGRLSHDEN